MVAQEPARPGSCSGRAGSKDSPASAASFLAAPPTPLWPLGKLCETPHTRPLSIRTHQSLAPPPPLSLSEKTWPTRTNRHTESNAVARPRRKSKVVLRLDAQLFTHSRRLFTSDTSVMTRGKGVSEVSLIAGLLGSTIGQTGEAQPENYNNQNSRPEGKPPEPPLRRPAPSSQTL